MTTDLTTALAQAKTGPLGLSDEREARAAAEEREIEAMARAIAENGGDWAFDRNCAGEEDRACYRSDAAAARSALDAVRATAPDGPATAVATEVQVAYDDDVADLLSAFIASVNRVRARRGPDPTWVLTELEDLHQSDGWGDPRRQAEVRSLLGGIVDRLRGHE